MIFKSLTERFKLEIIKMIMKSLAERLKLEIIKMIMKSLTERFKLDSGSKWPEYRIDCCDVQDFNNELEQKIMSVLEVLIPFKEMKV
jgi:hypothetical protein